MKCIKDNTTGVIRRTNDESAKNMVTTGEWSFCSKEEWKSNNEVPRKALNQNGTLALVST